LRLQRIEVLRAELDRMPRWRPRERSRLRAKLDRATRGAYRIAKQQERIQSEEFADLLRALGCGPVEPAGVVADYPPP
jgi:hypothetical protein